MALADLRAQLEAAEAADNGAPAARRRHVDAAVALFVALIDDLQDQEADDLFAMMTPLITHDARFEIETRRRLAHELAQIRSHDRATAQLRLAHDRAVAFGLSELAAELVAALERDRREEVILSKRSALRAAAERVSDPELASKMERSLASQASGAEAIAHARKSIAHARETVDAELIAEATSFLAELLVDAGELAEAKQLLEDRPPRRDGRADRALYDEIRRRQGEPVPDPPDEPDVTAQLAPAVRAYVTKPRNLAQAIVDGGLPTTQTLREWAVGTIDTVDDLDSPKLFGPTRSFWCSCGRFRGREYSGMTCHRCGVEIVHTAQRRTRVGCILLDAPALHPWYAPVAAALLDEPPAALGELRDRLDAVDLDGLAAQLKREVAAAPKAKLADQAGRRLAIVEAFRTTRIPPSTIVLDAVLVVPPDAPFPGVRGAYEALLSRTGTVAGVFDAFK